MKLSLGVFFLACLSFYCNAEPTALTASGAVQGKWIGLQARAFLGIPYAKPPVGARRWRTPEPISWTGTRNATAFGSVCPQVSKSGSSTVQFGSEDCLFLNVWTPNSAPPIGGWPVLVFIHGGAFENGSSVGPFVSPNSSIPMWNGAAFAAKTGSMVVTFTYRLGLLGYLAHPALSATSNGVSGNYGLLDQIASLEWVRRNARAFGGKPDNLTLYGQSAGAQSVCALMTQSLRRGLFDKAIIASSNCNLPTLTQAHQRGEKYFAELPCGKVSGAAAQAQCLRQLSQTDILKAQPDFSFDSSECSVGGSSMLLGPIVDGTLLKAAPMELIRAGQFDRVPLVIGHNTAEVPASACAELETEADFREMLRRSYFSPADVDDAVDFYRPSSSGDGWSSAFSQISTDIGFACPKDAMLDAFSGAGLKDLFSYQFNRATKIDFLTGAIGGLMHGGELPYVFQNLGVIAPYLLFPLYTSQQLQQQALAGQLWSSFISQGSSALRTQHQWQSTAASSPRELVISEVKALRPVDRAAKCELLSHPRGGIR